MAGVLLNQGKFDPAVESARKAIALDMRYARAHTALGMIYATMEDFPKALSAFRNALELDDKDANTWFLLGRSYFLSHQPGMAREALENALQLNPQVVEIYSQLAQTLARLGESSRAEEVFTQGVEKNRLRTPPDKGIHIAYGLFLAGLDRGEESCEQLRAVTRFAPQDPEAHYELAKVLFQMKRFAEAARAADRAVILGSLRLSDPLSAGSNLHGPGRCRKSSGTRPKRRLRGTAVSDGLLISASYRSNVI